MLAFCDKIIYIKLSGGLIVCATVRQLDLHITGAISANYKPCNLNSKDHTKLPLNKLTIKSKDHTKLPLNKLTINSKDHIKFPLNKLTINSKEWSLELMVNLFRGSLV
jgi:hypothetical protein